ACVTPLAADSRQQPPSRAPRRQGRGHGRRNQKHWHDDEHRREHGPQFRYDARRKEHVMTRLMILCASFVTLVGVTSAQAPAPQAKPDPTKIELRGDRFKALTWADMTPAQRTMVEHLFAGPRAGANGPFNVLLRSPEMGDIAQQFGASMRFNQAMP